MNALWLIIPITLLLVAGFVGAFAWATGSGQFDDLVTPAHRALLDEPKNDAIELAPSDHAKGPQP